MLDHFGDHLIARMTNAADSKARFTRRRACLLASVDRAKHLRWIKGELLGERAQYSAADVLQAALLAEIDAVLSPTLTASVWRQVAGELDNAQGPFDLVVDLGTQRATCARSPEELASALPRGREVIVIDLGHRAIDARAAISQYLSAAGASASTNELAA